MHKYLFFITTLLLSGICTLQLHGQAICSFDERYRHYKNDPVIAADIDQINTKVRTFIAERKLQPSRRTQTTLYTIPVVVHVMHTGDAVGSLYNPSDERIHDMIDYLNETFAGTWPGMIPQEGASAVTNVQIQFELAKRTPACGFTTGINRVDASSLPDYVTKGINASNLDGVPEISLKNLSRWNPAQYYNIWIVNKIDSRDGTAGQYVAGYAYLPGFPPEVDGTVMLATQAMSGNKVLPHEIGHAFGLHHTFHNSSNTTQCPTNNNCALEGDMVCDTDPVSNNVTGGVYDFTCRVGINGCTSSPERNYSVNTEHNLMAYTNCSYLFTEGQKDRMLAMMSIPSRASLVDPSNLSLSPCGIPAINFSVPTLSVRENAGGTLDGCRRYTDHTFYLEIGAVPSQNATVTLSISGTAIKGLDYDITTNGNFSSPSLNLLFSNASADPQPVSLRIYDDGDVESVENVVVNFSVDAAGGTAVKGSYAPTLTITIADNDQLVTPFNGNITLGTPNGSVDEVPFNATLPRQRSQVLYQARELSALGLSAGYIESIALNVLSKASSRPFTNFSIRAALTQLTHIRSGATTPVPSMIEVFNTPSFNTNVGWNTFTLNTPFWWDGESSMAVEFCFDMGTDGSNAGKDLIAVYSDGSDQNQSNLIFQNTINCSNNFSTIHYYPYGYKPVIRMGINIEGTNIETAAASATQHTESGGSEYFFSGNNRLMARVFDTDKSLECVNVAVTETGNNWQPFLGGQRSAKLLTIVPSVNAATANYSVSLYFANEELNGIDPSTIRIAKTNAISIAGADGNNTILAVPAVSTLGAHITVFTASFSGFSTFFLTNITSVLPVSLLEFKAMADSRQNVLINWKTTMEKNNAGFQLETSMEGTNFTILAISPSKGDTESGHSYQYTHEQPENGTHYYRLKQTDFDGQASYAPTVAVKINKKNVAKLMPVPAKDIVTLSFDKPLDKSTRVSVRNSMSQEVYTTYLTENASRYPIPVSNLLPGVYYLQLLVNGEPIVLRFIKE